METPRNKSAQKTTLKTTDLLVEVKNYLNSTVQRTIRILDKMSKGQHVDTEDLFKAVKTLTSKENKKARNFYKTALEQRMQNILAAVDAEDRPLHAHEEANYRESGKILIEINKLILYERAMTNYLEGRPPEEAINTADFFQAFMRPEGSHSSAASHHPSSTTTINPLSVSHSSSVKSAATSHPAPATHQGMIVVQGTIIKQPPKDDCCCTIMSLHKITYDNPRINELFNNRSPDIRISNMEEEKIINRLNAEYDLMHNIPTMPVMMGFIDKEIMQLDLIPAEFMEFVSTVAEMIGNYFSE